ncbi:hypothetical protein GF386_04375 [Candidatus Pacearchaeota archaeon]|nr:hypothetical protein [Candidatus Pacearchaeota archaeon]MBD3283360.1 hypothetical protein [Candidatus Pacearchaeota archaeon]
MNKRGQLAVFVFIAIVIFLIILVYFLPSRNIKTDSDRDVELIHSYIGSCVDYTLENAIFVVSLQGGYDYPPELSKDYLYLNIPYYWHGEKSHIPSIEDIEGELSSFIDSSFPNCIENLKGLEELGYNVEFGSISSEVEILDDRVIAEVYYPVTIKKGSDSFSLESFSSEIYSDLGRAYKFSEMIVEEQKKTPNEMPLGFITKLSHENNFSFEVIYDEEQSDVVYVLMFEKGDSDYFIYPFVFSYQWK